VVVTLLFPNDEADGHKKGAYSPKISHHKGVSRVFVKFILSQDIIAWSPS
jgi:hypothetical protein